MTNPRHRPGKAGGKCPGRPHLESLPSPLTGQLSVFCCLCFWFLVSSFLETQRVPFPMPVLPFLVDAEFMISALPIPAEQQCRAHAGAKLVVNGEA